MSERHYDVIVAGGGTAGAAAALALAQSDFKVAMIDPGKPRHFTHKSPIDLRVSTLTPASCNLLKRLGVWQAISKLRVSPFQSMRVWDENPDRDLVFRAADADLEDLGYVVENSLVQAALWEAIGSSKDVDPYLESRLESADSGARSVRVRLADGQRIRAELLVGADGAQSAVREHFGIEVKRWDYQQKGLVCVVSTAKPHQHTAWQRFQAGGPLAFLPLANGNCSIVWSQPSAMADARQAIDEADFENGLARALQLRLGSVELRSKRAVFPLQRLRARRYIGSRMVLLGDAAHVVHPLAGQGANLGYLDVAALVEVLSAARLSGQSIADQAVLRRYERWRVSDNEIVAEAMHNIRRLYGVDVTPLVGLRQLGAGLLNQSRFLRRRLIQHASGFGGRVPALVKPQLVIP